MSLRRLHLVLFKIRSTDKTYLKEFYAHIDDMRKR